ncbi:MAG: hypothetical protein CL535_11990 [Ahrensia sp.]|nr:hypothetical protein [Ahrensia sp.]|tara:strand:+ start:36980 stop:37429 length:450 start_codon:yes stop_codon:yes gene_type:complete
MTEMTLAEFTTLHHQRSAERPKIFLLLSHDKPASKRQIVDMEIPVGAQFPESFRRFLMEFGGGSFGLMNVFSADPASDYYLPDRQRKAQKALPRGCYAISDDYCGGWYVLVSKEGKLDNQIWYWNNDEGLKPTEFANVFELVAGCAYGT